MYQYRANRVKVVDGDTVHANVDLGCDTHLLLSLRFAHLNCPENSTPEGQVATAYTTQWFVDHAPGGMFLLDTIKDKREKYGRYLAEIHSLDGTASLNDDLLASGNAVAYEGGAR